MFAITVRVSSIVLRLTFFSCVSVTVLIGAYSGIVCSMTEWQYEKWKTKCKNIMKTGNNG